MSIHRGWKSPPRARGDTPGKTMAQPTASAQILNETLVRLQIPQHPSRHRVRNIRAGGRAPEARGLRM